jgi:hypothetical protein
MTTRIGLCEGSMRNCRLILVQLQARSRLGWFVIIVGMILYSFPRQDDHMDGSNINNLKGKVI